MRMRLRAGVIGLAVGLAGCAAILGIQDRPVADDGAPDGGVDASESGPFDPCSHLQPPSPSGVDDDPGSDHQRQYVVATHGVDLAPSGNRTLGFDLDDTCTCDGNSRRHDAGPSCASTTSRNCDEDGGTGIDNSFAQVNLFQVFSSSAFGGDGGEAEGITCGRSTFLSVLSKYNGLANDADVAISFVLSPGLQTPHESGEAPSGCNSGADAAVALPVVYTPRWDGTDRWSSDTNFVIAHSLSPSQGLVGYVRDWTLVARSRDADSVNLPFGPFVGDARGVIVRAHLVPKGDGTFRIDDGEIAARLTTASLLTAVANIPLGGKEGYLCPDNANAPLYRGVVQALCGARDILANPLQDFGGATCDSVSSAVRFFGDPAQMLQPIPPFTGDESPCADASPSCD